MIRHEDVQEELAAYAAGRLEGQSLRRVNDHLTECDECRDMADTFRDLATAIRAGGETLFEPHPSAAALRRHAIGGDTTELAAITRHLAACASCALEAGAWKRTGGPAALEGRGWIRTGRFRPAIAAAAGLLLGLGLAAFFMSRATSRTEAGPLLVLPRALRGEETVETYSMDSRQGVVVIACPAAIAKEAPPGELFRYEIRDEAGRVAWSRNMSASEIRRHLRGKAEVVTLLVPATSLGPGHHEFRLAPASKPESVIYRVRLEISAPR